MAFRPGGTQLITGALWGGETVVRNAQTLKKIVGLPVESDCCAVAFSSDGGTAALGHVDSSVTLWNGASWRRRIGWDGPGRGVQCLGFDADDHRLLVCDLTGHICQYDLQWIGNELAKIGLEWPVKGL